MEEQTTLEVVLSTILERYPTPDVEQKLAPEALLKDHLALSENQIFRVGLAVENYYQKELGRHFHIPDDTISAWQTVNDISESVKSLLSNH